MAMLVISRVDFSRNPSASTAVRMPPQKLNQPGANQVAHTFHVTHDSRNQRACLVGVVIIQRETSHVRLHLPASSVISRCPSLESKLRQRKRRTALNQSRAQHCAHQRQQQIRAMLADHVIHQEFWGSRQHQPATPADQQQEESSWPTARGADAPAPRSSAIPISAARRLISSSWDPPPLGQPALDQLSLHQLFSTQLQLPRDTPIMIALH